MSASKACAYCENKGPGTKEHIWPSWLLKRTDYPIRFSARANKVIAGELVISDVCAECNNGALSRLDDYALGLYEAYFSHQVADGEEIKFEYNFGLFLRWLLKVSYNASRTTKIDSEALKIYAPTLIAAGECSPIHAFAFVGTVKPAVNNKGGSTKSLEAKGARCGQLLLPGASYSDWCITRLVSINAYVFSLVILKERVLIESSELFDLCSQLYGVPLLPTGSIVIPAPQMDVVGLMNGVSAWPR